MALTPPGQASKQASAPIPAPKNTSKVIIIAIIIIIAAIVILWLFLRWQNNKNSNKVVNELSETKQVAQILESADNELIVDNNMENIVKQMTPEEKFAAAETINIQNGNHDSTIDDLGAIIKNVFGEYKITGYTQGYMGMNSGSGIVQYTLTKTLSIENADMLKQKMEDDGFTDITLDKQTESVNLQAKKNDYKYRLLFNQGDQEITVIIENIK